MDTTGTGQTTKVRFNIGDVVYYATFCPKTKVQVTCPVCYGKLEVTVTLGNGDSVVVPCDFCGKGYEGPQGTVVDYLPVANAEARVVTRINVQVTGDGEKREYVSMNSVLEDELCFATKEEAFARALELKEREETEANTRAERIKKDNLKSYSWNAWYHLRAAKDEEKRMEYHRKMAVLCKARSKETESGQKEVA